VGNSERAKLSIDGMADTAAGLLDALQVRQAVVGGVSMGGYAALSFARRYPDRLQGLILSNTRAAADNDEGRQNRSTMAQLAMSQGSAAIAEQMLPKLLGATSYKKNRKLVDRIREMIETTPPNVIADLLAAMAERADSTDLLASIDVPTLVICGDEDVLTPAEEARQWSAAIPRSTLVVMENAGHLSNLEAPERYNLIVRNFLERF
jgi:pimeloyl-ACP methyl ester carboxylesterase